MMIMLIIILILLAVEIFIAYIFYPLRQGQNYYRLIGNLEGFVYKFDPDVGYVHKPNLVHRRETRAIPNAPRLEYFQDVRIDRNGFIFDEDLSVLKGKYKLIFCIGGSTTEGINSPYEKTYPVILDSFLKQHGYRCINAGVAGYRSIHELLFFKKNILPWNPWGVIVFSGYNDFSECAYDDCDLSNPFKHPSSHSLPASRWEQILSYSAFFHFSKRLIYRISDNIRTETVSQYRRDKLKMALERGLWIDEWKSNISQIISLCSERGIKCYLLSHASPVYKNASQEVKDFAEVDLNMNGRFDIYVEYMDLIHKITLDIAKRFGGKFINITSDFYNYCLDNDRKMQYKKLFSLFVDRMHFSDEGNSLLAGLIYEKIRGDL